MAFSLTNDTLVTCSLDATVRVWRRATEITGGGDNDTSHAMMCVRTIDAGAPCTACVFQPSNNNLLVVGTARGSPQVLNISTGIVVQSRAGPAYQHLLPAAVGRRRPPAPVASMCVDEAGARTLWAGDERGAVTAYRIDTIGGTGRLTMLSKTLLCANRAVTSLCCRALPPSSAGANPVGWRAASSLCVLASAARNAIYLCAADERTGKLIVRNTISVPHERLGYVRSSFCPLVDFRSGTCVVSGGEDCMVHVFNGDTSRPLTALQAHGAPVTDARFNYDETMLASAAIDGTVIIWKRRAEGDNDNGQ